MDQGHEQASLGDLYDVPARSQGHALQGWQEWHPALGCLHARGPGSQEILEGISPADQGGPQEWEYDAHCRGAGTLCAMAPYLCRHACASARDMQGQQRRSIAWFALHGSEPYAFRKGRNPHQEPPLSSPPVSLGILRLRHGHVANDVHGGLYAAVGTTRTAHQLAAQA